MERDKGKGRSARKPKNGSKPLPWVDAKIYVGGYLDFVKKNVEYVGGEIYLKSSLRVSEMDITFVRNLVKSVLDDALKEMDHENFSIWYAIKPKSLTSMKLKAEDNDDVRRMLEARDDYNRISLYVVVEKNLQIPPTFFPRYRYRCKNPHFPTASQLNYRPKPSTKPTSSTQHNSSKKPSPDKKPSSCRQAIQASPTKVQPKTKVGLEPKQPTDALNTTPVRRSPRNNPEVILTGPDWIETSPTTTKAILQAENPRAKFFTGKKRPRVADKSKQAPARKLFSHKITSAAAPPISVLESPPLKTLNPVQSTKRTQARVKHVARKPKPKPNVKAEKREKRKEPIVNFDSEDSDHSFEGELSEESSDCDTDLDFDPEEEDRVDGGSKEGERGFAEVGVVTVALPGTSATAGGVNGADDVEFTSAEEVYYDSDELRSLHGSDDDLDCHATFNPEVDFKGNIELKKGLKFRDIHVLRKALQHHAVQNHYVYYLLHSEPRKLTAYCRYRCDCPWDSQHGIIARCTCKGKFKCNFRVFAQRMKGGTDLQIKTCRLHHECGYQDANPKATTQFLAEKYLDLWRADPTLGLKSFITIVQRDMGLKIEYNKAWMTRARAKLMLFGDASEEYARVFDYGHAILKHNPGSSVYITTEGGETGTHVFQRIYICLQACKQGFRAGCRPLIGVDGCHLKGPYPGMLLVAVGKDGNNCIYLVAWAIVEVENTESWTWFLSLLAADINFPDGQGLTIMSDRQKGLIDAVGTCLPKAEVRYCVRHIWANFKLQFSGQSFKEFFWHAARTCNVNVFNAQMQSIKMLNDEAYDYLHAIPKQHWARHEFQTFSKSNMLLNNLCETFNGVLRECRDKPVISCMEWIRKYAMRRNFEKLQSLDKVKSRFMPYVATVLKWVSSEANNCFPTQSSLDEWEVAHNGDDIVVNLKNWTCECKKWELTGIPCPHAYACILRRRENPENYVHHFYSKEMYCEAYKNNVRPMPGMKHWDVQNLTKPNPPTVRRMPGRPSKKKRKKSAGEDDEERFIRRLKRQNVCSNCGVAGHNRVKCQNVPAPLKHKDKGGRPYSNDLWVRNQRKRKEAKAMAVEAALQGQKAPSRSKTSEKVSQGAPVSSQASQSNPKLTKPKVASTKEVGECSKYATRQKLPVKPKKKKLYEIQD